MTTPIGKISDAGRRPPRAKVDSGPTEATVGQDFKGTKQITIPLSALIGGVTLLVGVATFSANFIFATKPEVAGRSAENAVQIHAVSERVTTLNGDLGVLRSEVVHLRAAGERVDRRLDALDRNLRLLMIRQGVTPVPEER